MNQRIPLALSYDDVLLVPQYSNLESRTEVDLSTKISPHITLKIPIVSANMTNVTGVEMAIALGKLGGLGVIPRFMSPESQADEIAKVKRNNGLVGAAIGVRNGMFGRAEMLIKAKADIFFLDVAHGHMQKVIDCVKKFKTNFPSIDLVAGNVATYEATVALFKAGADCVKVGIGPGSICTTRIMTGSGVPQITAILEAVKATRKYKKTCIADGGAKSSGDLVKGLAAGASAHMVGNIVAGTDEAPGDKVKLNGKWFKSYNGSTSLAEKKNHLVKNGEEFEKNYTKQVEGVEGYVPYKGPLNKVMEKYIANLRSGLSYSGAKNIPELWNKAKFVQITSMGMRESGAHDVIQSPSK